MASGFGEAVYLPNYLFTNYFVILLIFTVKFNLITWWINSVYLSSMQK